MINKGEALATIAQDMHPTSDVGAKMADGIAANAFEAMQLDYHRLALVEERDLWFDREQEKLLNVNDGDSIFNYDFPLLPEFPCISSSSAQAVEKQAIAVNWCSSSTSAALSSTTPSMEISPQTDIDGLVDIDCIHMMEDFEFSDLIDSDEFRDQLLDVPGNNAEALLKNEYPVEAMLNDDQVVDAGSGQDQTTSQCEQANDGFSFIQENAELTKIFLEWLKQNRDRISAEDMRSIKLKRSAVESASKLLGSTEEGKKQLLKLILRSVEQYKLPKKPSVTDSCGSQSPYTHQEIVQNPNTNQSPNLINPNLGGTYQSPPHPNPNPNYSCTYQLPPNPNPCVPASSWMSSPQTSHVVAHTIFPCSIPGYSNGGPYSNMMVGPSGNHVVNGIPYPHSAESWAPASVVLPPQFSLFPPLQQAVYRPPFQNVDPNGELGLEKLGSSATKEARRRRMARQRELNLHRPRHNSKRHKDHMDDPNLAEGSWENDDQDSLPGNWESWSPMNALDTHSGDGSQQSFLASSDRTQQQGLDPEKNLKFLLQKALKPSDVGNLGRIVLPKKDAEAHLPELDSRDGITMVMEDIGTSQVWKMRYRFWPNNKSRMYLLENTGGFVSVNGLQEGDYIAIYSDTKCGKYMIRGVKVRYDSLEQNLRERRRRGGILAIDPLLAIALPSPPS